MFALRGNTLMSNKREKNSDDGQALNPMILREIPVDKSLVIVNKMLIYAVLALMAIVMVMGFFLMPSQDLLNSYQTAQLDATYKARENPVLSAEIDALKGQMIGLVSGSIESKLRTLEQSVKLGSVTYSLGTIEDLKSDVKVLRAYTEKTKQVPADTSNEQLLKEMSHLKNLIYLTVASCGLMLAAIGGVWFRNRYLLTHKKPISGFLGKR
ncbi:MAG: hypothetical protein Q7U30_09385 [Methylicorpusculum sp.]|nr:hypothetical protein [Methylicorpusculum sp.]